MNGRRRKAMGRNAWAGVSAVFIMAAGSAEVGASTAQGLSGAVARCADVAVALERLACYDALAASATMNPSLAGEGAGDAGLAPVAPAPQPVEAASGARADEPRSSFRVQAFAGYGQGRHDGTFDVAGGEVALTALTGGAGAVTGIGVFWDDAIAPGWSIGAEYVHLGSKARGTARFPSGLSIVTDPVSAEVVAEAEAHMGFLDIVYRPEIHHGVRPFLGGGIGVGYGRAELRYGAGADVLGHFSDSSKAASIVPGFQAMAGLDLDLTDSTYFSAFSRVLYFTGYPVTLEQRFIDVVLGAGLGYRF